MQVNIHELPKRDAHVFFQVVMCVYCTCASMPGHHRQHVSFMRYEGLKSHQRLVNQNRVRRRPARRIHQISDIHGAESAFLFMVLFASCDLCIIPYVKEVMLTLSSLTDSDYGVTKDRS